MELKLNISGYEGPLDLLLELSQKQKVDIKKISILELSNQYLDFVEKNRNRLKLSADYLVMASLLAFLKSKLLLPQDDNNDSSEIEEDLTNRIIHYSAIKKLSKLMQNLPQSGRDFEYIKIKNDFVISNKVVPKSTLQDLILQYLEILKKNNSLKSISIEDNYYSLEDGLNWLRSFIDNDVKKNWNFLFDFLPKQIANKEQNRSAIVSLLLASLSEVKNGKISLNQKDNFDDIMIRIE